jgi:hypothetical protein
MFRTQAEREQFWARIDRKDCVAHPGFIPEQHGPMRHFDREMRCASPGCGSPTHFKLEGIPRCMVHCLREMNEMLIGMGINV